MELAVRTTASPAAIWTICAVAVACLAFWLIMVMVVANRPDPRLRRVAAMSGSVFGGIGMATGDSSVAAARHSPVVAGGDLAAEQEAARVPAQREPGQAPAAGAAGTAAEAPTEPIPEQRSTAEGAASTDAAGSGTAGRP
jgi:hypothetical protein